MQIVIDIPEDVYTRLFDNGIQDNEIAVDDVCEMARALRLGTPLPKGHGRLIDADSMKTMKNIQSANFNAVELIRLWIDKQDTIIEAETEDD